MTLLTPRFAEAVEFARVAHATQFRKGSGIPYIYHLLGVSSLVIEFGGDEDQAIAGLLHDVVEDCGAEEEHKIRAQFGDAVAAIVMDCTDGTSESKEAFKTPEEKKQSWWDRKLAYIEHLEGEPDASLLVSGCDKLHNARAILQDLESKDPGMAVFERFTGGLEGTLAYYESIARVLTARKMPTAEVFDSVVAQIHVLAGECERRALHVSDA